MKQFSVLMLFMCMPFSLFAQHEEKEPNLSSVVITENKTTNEKYQLITPVLLRNNFGSSLLFDEDLDSGISSAGSVFFSSLIVPGSGQISNRSWFRAGMFLAIEATSIFMAVEYRNRGVNGERDYERWANNNWSVVQYSNWLVDYHNYHNINNSHINELKEMVDGVNPAFNIRDDWDAVDISVLRDVERNTPYFTTDDIANQNFSHVLPEYGSQQYYELIAKYYQYQAGWRDYNDFHDSIGNTGRFFEERYYVDRNGRHASHFFFDGARRAQQFNDDYRTSNFFIHLLIANHIISAFDAYFTVRVQQRRLQASSSMIPGQQIVIKYRF
ncbi:MAG: hypothetical protein JJU13_05095 [Balneolaceae bacterium]|nr:hypothetical protein [Balneolaceae bacterium]